MIIYTDFNLNELLQLFFFLSKQIIFFSSILTNNNLPLKIYCEHIVKVVGSKDLGTLTHFISDPWPMPRRKKCPRMNKENPDCQDILSRMTLSSTDQNHGRGKRHAARGGLLEHPKGSSERSGPAMGVW